MPVRSWTLIYDGECEFCQRQIDWVRRLDADKRVRAVPYQEAQLERLNVSREAAATAMHLVSAEGEVWQGAEAACELLRLLPYGRPIAWLFRVPGAMSIAEFVYRWVARRRHRFGCSSDHCRRGPNRDLALTEE